MVQLKSLVGDLFVQCLLIALQVEKPPLQLIIVSIDVGQIQLRLRELCLLLDKLLLVVLERLLEICLGLSGSVEPGGHLALLLLESIKLSSHRRHFGVSGGHGRRELPYLLFSLGDFAGSRVLHCLEVLGQLIDRTLRVRERLEQSLDLGLVILPFLGLLLLRLLKQLLLLQQLLDDDVSALRLPLQSLNQFVLLDRLLLKLSYFIFKLSDLGEVLIVLRDFRLLPGCLDLLVLLPPLEFLLLPSKLLLVVGFDLGQLPPHLDLFIVPLLGDEVEVAFEFSHLRSGLL